LTDVPEIDIDTLEQQIADGVLVIDVREDDEYVGGHIGGAVHIALGAVPDRVGELPTDAPLLVVCAVGGRSGRAVQFLRAQGVDATNVAGGTKAWAESGRPLVSGPDPS
jgi:rhodanese-related sulfurtransferase